MADILDRFAVALGQALGRVPAPALTVQQLATTVLPYRRWRDALGLESAEEYEHTLLRLLAGERGYCEASVAMQDQLREELGRPSPDLTAYRRYASEAVTLVAAPGLAASGSGSSVRSVPDVASPRPSVRIPGPAPAPVAAPPAVPEVAMPMPHPRAVSPEALGGRCRYCSHELPAGRPLIFCPYCGQNLTTLRCPACSTELELGWRFCVTCGRRLE